MGTPYPGTGYSRERDRREVRSIDLLPAFWTNVRRKTNRGRPSTSIFWLAPTLKTLKANRGLESTESPNRFSGTSDWHWKGASLPLNAQCGFEVRTRLQQGPSIIIDNFNKHHALWSGSDLNSPHEVESHSYHPYVQSLVEWFLRTGPHDMCRIQWIRILPLT